jgi:predicted adenylyl cyclase CyaB
MAKNIEIKARVRDAERLAQLVELLCDDAPRTLVQRDVFFFAAQGRLKLRITEPDGAYLVHYDREDTSGPRPSEYVLSEVSDPATLERTLTAALGVRGEVRKVRKLYMVGNTRIHLDRVEGLGDYVELEAVVGPEQSVEQGYRHVNELLEELKIDQQDLVDVAYFDLLQKDI